MTNPGDSSELTVSIKTEDATFKKKFLLYEQYHLDSVDPVIRRCIDDALAELKGGYADDEIEIKVRAFLQI